MLPAPHDLLEPLALLIGQSPGPAPAQPPRLPALDFLIMRSSVRHAATQAHHRGQRGTRRPGRRGARGQRKAANQASARPRGEPTGIALAAVAVVMPLALAACGSSPGKPTTSTGASVVLAPVQVAHTPLGAVGYRAVGSGPPLVLIMGYTGTMADWDPRFVDALARHYRVVIFDNAGVGRTQPLPAPLTIDAMADQTSALISSLGLGRSNILGWSPGRHDRPGPDGPARYAVRRLVLCATFPGTGAVPPSLAAIRALLSGVPQDVGAELFPADQSMAFKALAAGISAYPAASPAPAATIAAQGRASERWFGGADPAGPIPVLSGQDPKGSAVRKVGGTPLRGCCL